MSYIKKQNFYFIIFLIFFLNLEKSECDSLSKSPRKNKQKVGVYYGNWHGYGKLDICRIPGEKIDYLFYAFLNPSSGECEFSDPKIDLEKIGPKDGICESSDLQTESDPIRGNLYQLSKLKLRFPHIKIIASIGGWSFSKAFHDFILTDEKRIKLVDSCVNLIKLYSNIFDGLDIDLEYPCLPNDIPCGPKIIPSSDDRGHFASLLQEFRKKLGENYYLTIAINSGKTKIDALDLEKIDPIINFYNLMTYDFTSASFGAEYSGHHTQLYGNPDDPMRYRKEMNVESATNYLIEKGASSYKINIGVAFYGYGFNIPKKESNHPFIRSYGTLNMDVEEQNTFDYSEIKQKYINVYTDRFDEVSKVPYIYDQKKGIFITYDNRKSIMEKTRFLREKGLMGIFCWELSSDTKDFELTDAMGD